MFSADPPTLAGERCSLRLLRAGDASNIARYADDEAVWCTLHDGFPHPYTLADAQAWCGGAWRDPRYGTAWGIEVDDQVIGCIGAREDSGAFRCNAEVGYWIGRPFWGRGIATEALALVTAWAWSARPELTRLYAPIFAWNQASQRVAAKCGYVLEGLLRQSAIKDGKLIDLAQYAAYRVDASAEYTR